MIIVYQGTPPQRRKFLDHDGPHYLRNHCYVENVWHDPDNPEAIDLVHPGCPICNALIPYDREDTWLEKPTKPGNDYQTIGVARRCPNCGTVFIPQAADLQVAHSMVELIIPTGPGYDLVTH